jgi:hypothetical protein
MRATSIVYRCGRGLLGKCRTNKGLQGFCICAILSVAFETPERRLNLNEKTSLDRINRTRRDFQR